MSQEANAPIAIRRSGKIKFWKETGYGFIIPDDGGKDVFVHATQTGGSGIAKDTAVTFILDIDPRSGKPAAFDVRVAGR